jgi:hypothetical protein
LNIHSPFFFRHIETIASEVLDQVPLDSAVVAHHVDDMLKFRQYAVELSDAFRWVIRTGQIETFLIVQVLAKLTHFNSAEFLQNTYDFADSRLMPQHGHPAHLRDRQWNSTPSLPPTSRPCPSWI